MTDYDRNAYDKLRRDAGRAVRERANAVRGRMHFRREGMVTVCGVRLDDERERRARFTDDLATLRRAVGVCEVCKKGGV